MGRCKRRSARRLDEYAWVVKPIRAFLWRNAPCMTPVWIGNAAYGRFISSVDGGIEIRPPPSDLCRALFSQALLVLRGHPGVASWLSHEGLTKFEGGLCHELAPPDAVLSREPIRCRPPGG